MADYDWTRRQKAVQDFLDLNVGEPEELTLLTTEEIEEITGEVKKLFELFPLGIESDNFMIGLEKIISQYI